MKKEGRVSWSRLITDLCNVQQKLVCKYRQISITVCLPRLNTNLNNLFFNSTTLHFTQPVLWVLELYVITPANPVLRVQQIEHGRVF